MIELKGGTRPPWVGLGAAVWVQVAAGNGYNFPLYSHSLKEVLGFNQHQITLLGVANDIGENVGILPGLACNKFAPWVILLVGCFACFLGYGVIWLALTRTVLSLPFWLLWIALCVATNSTAWFGTAVLVTNMRNFPLSRGTVAGIIKGYAGLSAAVYTQVYGILHDSSTKLLMFLALGIPAICLLLMFFVRPCTPASGDDSSEQCHFLFTQAASIVLGIYVLATTILVDVLSLSTPISYTLLVVMVLLLMAPLAIPIKMTFYPSQPVGPTKSSDQESSDMDKTEPLITPSSSAGNLEREEMSELDLLLAEGEGAIRKKRKPRRGEDFKFHEALIKADFWLLFLISFVGVGTSVTVLNNLAQIGIAQHMDDTKILLSLFSFCSFVGRLGGGVISEHFVRSRATPRTVWIAVSQLIMVITFLLYASSLDGSLYAATVLLGLCYGAQGSTIIPAISELFGLKHFGIISSFMGLGNPIGAYLFSGLLAGYLYDNEAAKQESSTCLGPTCFRLTFLILAGVCCMGSMLCAILTWRVKPVYRMLYAGGSFRLPSNH